MPEQQRCECGDAATLHRLDRKVGKRHECWAVNPKTLRWPGCRCEQFRAAERQEVGE